MSAAFEDFVFVVAAFSADESFTFVYCPNRAIKLEFSFDYFD